MNFRFGYHNPLVKDDTPSPQLGNMVTPSNARVSIYRPPVMTMKNTMARTNTRSVDDMEMVSYVWTPLSIKWVDDYNILIVHQKISAHLKSIKKQRAILQEKLKVAKMSLKPQLNASEIASIRLVIEKLEKEYQQICTVSYLEYASYVNPIINEYRTLSNAKAVVMGQQSRRDANGIARKTQLVESYLDIAKKYVSLDIVRNVRSSGLCRICNGVIVDIGEKYCCSDCDIIQPKIEHTDDNDHLDSGIKKSGYESGSNFRDLVHQFQLTYPVTIPDKVIDAITHAINQYQNYDIKELTRPDLVILMKELGLGSWYKHLNKIYFILTGKRPRDFTSITVNIIKRGSLLYDIYESIKPDDRSNFIHGLHLLWLFMKNEGFEPDMDEFYLLKSRDVELSNLETLRKGFEILRETNPEFKWELFQIP